MLSGRLVGESKVGELEDLNRQEFFSPELKHPAAIQLPELSDWQPPRLPRQVVTLAFIGEANLNRAVSEHLAQSLYAETKSPLILVRFTRLHQPGPKDYLNGEFHLPATLDRTEAGFHLIPVGVKQDDPPSPAGIMSLMEKLSRHFRYVLIEAPAGSEDSAWITELLLR